MFNINHDYICIYNYVDPPKFNKTISALFKFSYFLTLIYVCEQLKKSFPLWLKQ